MRRLILRFAALGGVLLVAAVAFLASQLRTPNPPAPPLEGTLRGGSLTVDGRERTFHYYVPRRLRPSPPLLLVLHGSSMNGLRMRRATAYDFDEIADREGFVVAYPNGHGGNWNDCRAAAKFESRRLGIDDVRFLRALITWFEREHGTGDVFAAGLSNGGHMAYRLALEAPELVRGAAAIAANLAAPGNQLCTPSDRPIPVMIVNGTDDPLNPFGGGRVALFGLFFRRGNVQSSEETAGYWKSLAGLTDPPAVEFLPDVVPDDGARARRLVWSAAGRAPVALIVVEGGGHTIPLRDGEFPRLLGRTCRDFSAPQAIWDFFSDLDWPASPVEGVGARSRS